jgi:hypothetical protein
MGMYLAGWHEYTRLFEEDQKVLVYNEWGDVNIWKIKYGWYQF